MRIKALRGFSGKVAMAPGEERDVRDEIAADLIKAGYAAAAGKPAAPEPPEKGGSAATAKKGK